MKYDADEYGLMVKTGNRDLNYTVRPKQRNDIYLKIKVKTIKAVLYEMDWKFIHYEIHTHPLTPCLH